MTCLTNREAALHLCNGGKLEYYNGTSWIVGNGTSIKLGPNMIDEPSSYRKAVETITCNGFTVPKPISDPLKYGDVYWLAAPHFSRFTTSYVWFDVDANTHHFSRGLIHLTEAAAIAHAKAMIGKE